MCYFLYHGTFIRKNCSWSSFLNSDTLFFNGYNHHSIFSTWSSPWRENQFEEILTTRNDMSLFFNERTFARMYFNTLQNTFINSIELRDLTRNDTSHMYNVNISDSIGDNNYIKKNENNINKNNNNDINNHNVTTMRRNVGIKQILTDGVSRGFHAGVSGGIAMTVQVMSLMWINTATTYQFRYGHSIKSTFVNLYRDGGIVRFYRGSAPALAVGFLSRFGDTAANASVPFILNEMESSKKWTDEQKTALGSFAAGVWRVAITPIVVLRTNLQVDGDLGWKNIRSKFSVMGYRMWFQGAVVQGAHAFIGHFPWFYTYNKLETILPRPSAPSHSHTVTQKMWLISRDATIGFGASTVAIVISNPIKILQTFKQSYSEPVSYWQAATLIIRKDGWKHAFFRGIHLRIATSGLQGVIFVILWRRIQAWLPEKRQ